MMGHGRAPAVQYRRNADAGSEVLRVGRDPEHRLRRGLEQQIVDHGLVLVGDVANRRRQREDDVEVGNREQFGLARRHPLARSRALALRAVPVAAANGRRPLAALWANSVMGSWRPASAANLAVFQMVRRRSACLLLSITTVVRRDRPTGDRAPGRHKVFAAGRRGLDAGNLRPPKSAAPWIPTRSSKPLRPTWPPALRKRPFG